MGWGGDGYNKYVEQLRARKQDKNILCDRGREMYNQYVEHLRAQKQVKHTLWGREGMCTTSTLSN